MFIAAGPQRSLQRVQALQQDQALQRIQFIHRTTSPVINFQWKPKKPILLNIFLGFWFYFLLIRIPTPAFCAVFMLSILVDGRLLGQVHQPLYALFATAFFFIFLNPAVIYEFSFQLFFLAVLFILWYLPIYPHHGENDVLWRHLVKYGLIIVGITSG